MTVLFVSDLHLHASRPAASECFFRFLEGPAREAKALFILGDLFEAWIGDDAPAPHEREVMNALRSLVTSGVSCSVMPGNRDFLLTARFARESGTTLLPDETRLELSGRPALLMHGDTLCTDDHAYLRYRRIVHHPVTQAAFLALPATLRNRIASFARRRSLQANAGKPAQIMDVNASAVDAALARHDVDLLIHGHTHRPAIHRWDTPRGHATRIVLGDWYEQGSVLKWAAGTPELMTLRFG